MSVSDVLCNCCATVISGARFKCLSCLDYDLCNECICSQSSNHDPANHVVLQVDDSASKVKSNVRRRQVEIMEQLMFLEGLEDYGVDIDSISKNCKFLIHVHVYSNDSATVKMPIEFIKQQMKRLCKEVDKQLREGRDEIDSLPRLTSAFKMEHDCKAEVDIPLVTIWDSLLSLNAVDLNKSPSNELTDGSIDLMLMSKWSPKGGQLKAHNLSCVLRTKAIAELCNRHDVIQKRLHLVPLLLAPDKSKASVSRKKRLLEAVKNQSRSKTEKAVYDLVDGALGRDFQGVRAVVVEEEESEGGTIARRKRKRECVTLSGSSSSGGGERKSKGGTKAGGNQLSDKDRAKYLKAASKESNKKRKESSGLKGSEKGAVPTETGQATTRNGRVYSVQEVNVIPEETDDDEEEKDGDGSAAAQAEQAVSSTEAEDSEEDTINDYNLSPWVSSHYFNGVQGEITDSAPELEPQVTSVDVAEQTITTPAEPPGCKVLPITRHIAFRGKTLRHLGVAVNVTAQVVNLPRTLSILTHLSRLKPSTDCKSEALNSLEMVSDTTTAELLNLAQGALRWIDDQTPDTLQARPVPQVHLVDESCIQIILGTEKTLRLYPSPELFRVLAKTLNRVGGRKKETRRLSKAVTTIADVEKCCKNAAAITSTDKRLLEIDWDMNHEEIPDSTRCDLSPTLFFSSHSSSSTPWFEPIQPDPSPVYCPLVAVPTTKAEQPMLYKWIRGCFDVDTSEDWDDCLWTDTVAEKPHTSQPSIELQELSDTSELAEDELNQTEAPTESAVTTITPPVTLKSILKKRSISTVSLNSHASRYSWYCGYPVNPSKRRRRVRFEGYPEEEPEEDEEEEEETPTVIDDVLEEEVSCPRVSDISNSSSDSNHSSPAETMDTTTESDGLDQASFPFLDVGYDSHWFSPCDSIGDACDVVDSSLTDRMETDCSEESECISDTCVDDDLLFSDDTPTTAANCSLRSAILSWLFDDSPTEPQPAVEIRAPPRKKQKRQPVKKAAPPRITTRSQRHTRSSARK